MSTTIDPAADATGGASPAGDPVPVSAAADAPAPVGGAAARVPTPAQPRRRIPPMVYGILVVAVFFGGIGIAYAGGAWQTSGRMGGQTGGETGGESRPTLQGMSATEVKGWMLIGDVAETFGVPYEDLLAAFELPADTAPGTALKELESELFSVMALREWLVAEGYAAG